MQALKEEMACVEVSFEPVKKSTVSTTFRVPKFVQHARAGKTDSQKQFSASQLASAASFHHSNSVLVGSPRLKSSGRLDYKQAQ